MLHSTWSTTPQPHSTWAESHQWHSAGEGLVVVICQQPLESGQLFQVDFCQEGSLQLPGAPECHQEIVPPEPYVHHWSEHRLQLHLNWLVPCRVLPFDFPPACGSAVMGDLGQISPLCPFAQVLLPVAGCHCCTRARNLCGGCTSLLYLAKCQRAPYDDGSNDSTNFQSILFTLLKLIVTAKSLMK